MNATSTSTITPHTASRPGLPQLLPAGWIAPLALFSAWLAGGLAHPGFSFMTGHGSELALGPGGWIMEVGFALTGVALLTFAAALFAARTARVAAALVAIGGVGFLVSAAVPMDPRGAPASAAGGVHDAAFAVMFIALTVGAVAGGVALRSRLPRHLPLSIASGLGGFVLLFVFMIAGSDPGDPLYPVSGILQLLVVGLALAWPALTAVRLRRAAAGSAST